MGCGQEASPSMIQARYGTVLQEKIHHTVWTLDRIQVHQDLITVSRPCQYMRPEFIGNVSFLVQPVRSRRCKNLSSRTIQGKIMPQEMTLWQRLHIIYPCKVRIFHQSMQQGGTTLRSGLECRSHPRIPSKMYRIQRMHLWK